MLYAPRRRECGAAPGGRQKRPLRERRKLTEAQKNAMHTDIAADFQPTWPPQDAHWARTAKGRFHNLNTSELSELGVSGVSGVYAVWHGGIRPRWVYIARADDLAAAMEDALRNEEILPYHLNGGLFVSWSVISRQFQDGVVRYLHTVLAPAVENPDVKQEARPVAVNAPGLRADEMRHPHTAGRRPAVIYAAQG